MALAAIQIAPGINKQLTETGANENGSIATTFAFVMVFQKKLEDGRKYHPIL